MMAPICPVCELEMERRVVPFGLGGAAVKDTPYYFCPNVDDCGNAKPEDEEMLRRHYLHCWDTGKKSITYGELR